MILEAREKVHRQKQELKRTEADITDHGDQGPRAMVGEA